MVAKLIAHGRTRDEARSRLLKGLADTLALGLPTNQAFLSACLRHPEFAGPGATTGFVPRHADDLVAADAAAQRQVLALVAALAHGSPDAPLQHRYVTPLRLQAAGATDITALRLQRDPGQGLVVEIGDERMTVALLDASGETRRVRLDGVLHTVQVLRDPADAHTWHVQALGRPWTVHDHSHQAALKAGGAGGDGKLRASMNGRVVKVAVQPGDAVQAGQPVVTLEAMKMEHVHTAPVAGTIAAIHVTEGEQVAMHRVVVEITPAGAEAGAASEAAQAA
jgi:geranyl-CoA carboxylase alpha subunit